MRQSSKASTAPPFEFIDVKEFKDIGFLQEANRLFFHPHGLALAVTEFAGEWKIAGIYDLRDDPEGMIFSEESRSSKEFKEKADRVKAQADIHSSARITLLGGRIQKV